MAKDVWFGVHLPSEGKDWNYMREACLGVEANGYDLFTTTDHFMNMWNPKGPENHPLECWTLLSSLAAVTNRVKLGPLVGCYGYRQPTVLAKIATSVDIISGGGSSSASVPGGTRTSLMALWVGSLQLQRDSAVSARP